MRQLNRNDRVGLGWRPELAAAIFTHLEQIDVLEVILDDLFEAPKRQIRAIEALGRHVPLLYHGVSLGLASANLLDDRRISRVARTLDKLKAPAWSEHLAFVRAGGIEIGHLAAPPRTLATIDGACVNLERLTRATGLTPSLENIATLIDPPFSSFSESAWVSQITRDSKAPLLLDLHNLYANALNFGRDPTALLLEFPLARVQTVHLSGGKWIAEPGARKQRLLDDHVHDVPDPVFHLLTTLAAATDQDLTVVIERDGEYPRFEQILAQMSRARAALAAGRALRKEVADERHAF